jgi:hypothetical protein
MADDGGSIGARETCEELARMKKTSPCVMVCIALLSAATLGRGEEAGGDSEAELAKKLQNPVANLISVPIQSNWDFNMGRTNAMRYLVNVQPVIPLSLTEDWNLITRTIVPIVHQEALVDPGEDLDGMGDVLQSLFLSPKDPVHGWIVGAGPVFNYPTATENALGSQKWGAGPTAVVLQQRSGWTYGMLTNQVWSFAGSSHRTNVSSTFLQPFLSYTTATHTTFLLNTESTYDWRASQWTVPLNPTVSQVLKIGSLPLTLGVGGRYYAEKPSGGPDWGLRFIVTLLLPTG